MCVGVVKPKAASCLVKGNSSSLGIISRLSMLCCTVLFHFHTSLSIFLHLLLSYLMLFFCPRFKWYVNPFQANAFIQSREHFCYYFRFLQPTGFLCYNHFVHNLLPVAFTVKKIIAPPYLKRPRQYRGFSISDNIFPTMASKSQEEIILFMTKRNLGLAQRMHLLSALGIFQELR